MGAILTQEINGTEQVISTFSRKFNDAQLKYTVGEQELLAAHEACRFFHDIIFGCDILIRLVTTQFDINWLCHYPRPTEVGYDNGKEFMGEEFQELLASYNITAKPTTVNNPTAQALVERLHLTLGDQLRTSIYPINDWHEDVNHLLQSCAWAICTTVPSNTPHNPRQLVFGMDMIFRQQTKIDWQLLKRQRRNQAIVNSKKENKNRVPHDYKIGDLVLIVQKPYERKRKAKINTPT
ncbi:hypothetical protein ACHAW6_014046 [Cyclotella cf. meneghiniana]